MRRFSEREIPVEESPVHLHSLKRGRLESEGDIKTMNAASGIRIRLPHISSVIDSFGTKSTSITWSELNATSYIGHRKTKVEKAVHCKAGQNETVKVN